MNTASGGLRILVVGELAEARRELARQLVSDRCEIIDASLEVAEAEIRRERPDVLLVLVPAAGGVDVLRALCATDPTGAMYVIAVISENQPARASSSAIAAGSHDVLCAPYTAPQLRACVDVQRRLRRWIATRLRIATTVESVRSRLTELRAWQYLGEVIADDLETMLGRPLEIDEGWPAFGESMQLATIAMTLASEQLELCISIVADAATRRWLGVTLLGDPAAADDVLDDIMREMANVAGGALKRAALPEGPTLSTGLPIDGRSLPVRDSGARCWTIPIEDGVCITVIGEVRHRANRRIPARRLSEGMIVVSDVCNRVGTLLLPSGTRLTSTTAERLSNLLDATLIEVSG